MEIQIILNDLPFADLTKACIEVERELERKKIERVFVVTKPGSFYTQLFPTGSVDILINNLSLFWLRDQTADFKNLKGLIVTPLDKPKRQDLFDLATSDWLHFLSLARTQLRPHGRLLIGIKSVHPEETPQE